MADWKHIVRARLAQLRLTPSAESELADEIAQHLDDLYHDLKHGGAADDDAYRATLSELEDIWALRTGLDESQCMTRHEHVPMGDAKSSIDWTVPTLSNDGKFLLIEYTDHLYEVFYTTMIQLKE